MNPQRDTESIGSLVRRLIVDGRTYVRAEVEVYRHKALAWVPPVRTAAVLAILALFLAQAAITTLLVFLGFWLALWFGPLGGGIAAALLGLIVAGLFVWIAVRKLTTPPPGAKA